MCQFLLYYLFVTTHLLLLFYPTYICVTEQILSISAAVTTSLTLVVLGVTEQTTRPGGWWTELIITGQLAALWPGDGVLTVDTCFYASFNRCIDFKAVAVTWVYQNQSEPRVIATTDRFRCKSMIYLKREVEFLFFKYRIDKSVFKFLLLAERKQSAC